MSQQILVEDSEVDFQDLEPDIQQLILKAVEARKRSYSPYSKFAVGAAVRSVTGEIFYGCNIENSAFGPSICAERTAIFKGISEGHLEYDACAVVAFQENGYTAPCGTCRQVLNEFASKDFPIYIAKPSHEKVLCSSVYNLLPYRFRLKD